MQEYTVAVTGVTGMVGTQVVRHLLKAGYKVQAAVRSRPVAGHPTYQEHVTITTINLVAITEQEVLDWLTAVKPIALIHCVAMTDVEGCERQPSMAYFMNTHVPEILAKACAHLQIHYIMVSTDYVFDGTHQPEQLYCEDDLVHPLNHYGNSKLLGERMVQDVCAEKTLWTVCRTAVVYGTTPGARPDFTRWLRMKLSQNEVIRIAIDQINSPTYSSDLARMVVGIVQHRLSGIYHTTGSTPISRYQFALIIARDHGLDESFIQPMLTSNLSQIVQRPLHVGLCVDKISQHLGVSPLSLAEGLAASWLQAQEEFLG